MSIKYCCLVLLFSPLLQVQAQPPVFEHFTDSHSLSQSTINCIVQDRRGFLWVGTENGLNRYDPDRKRFLHFTTREGLPSNSVQGILQDADGFLWVTTD